MARVSLAEFASTTEITAHTVTFSQPSTPGQAIVAFYDSAAVVTAPVGWVKTQLYLGLSETGVLILPAASHTVPLTEVVLTNSATRHLTVYVFEDAVAGDVLSYTPASVQTIAATGSAYGTGLHTFTSDEALALFSLRGAQQAGPIGVASLSYDSGFAEEMVGITTGNLTYEPNGQWVGGKSSASFSNEGVSLTFDGSIVGVNGVGALIGYDTGGGDTTGPVVISRIPTVDATDVSVTINPSVTFDEPLGAGYDIALSPAVGGSVSYSNETLTFTPTSDLADSTLYTVTASGLEDALGNTSSDVVWSFTTGVAAAPTPWGATIADEIAYPGDSSGNWTITGMGSTDALGFTDQLSYDVGDQVNFKVHSTTSTVIDIYRIGGYDTGWRKVGTCSNAPTSQPNPIQITDSNNGTEASAWTTTATWSVPSGAWSGMFVGVVRVAADASYIPFIVRDDARTADVVVKTSETTWGAAYNHYGTPGVPQGGASLYGQNGDFVIDTRCVAVSFDKPIITRHLISQTYWLNAEAPLWRWLDKQGIDWKLIASVDLDEGLTAVGSAKALVSSGHDEYWSQGMWDNAETFRDAGGHLVFMSANAVFWRVRFSPDRRTMWCYKDTMTGPSGLGVHTAGDPLDPVSWTGTWRDTRRPGGAESENLLTGTFFRMNGIRDETAQIVAANVGSSPFWRGTTVETGTDLTLPRVVGFEADDYDPTQSFETLVAATSINIDGSYADINGEDYAGNGTLNWGIQLQRYPSGAVVVGFGTNQWSWALDGVHDRTNTTPSIPAQQATINLLTDMGAVAATPTSGLVSPSPLSWSEYGLGYKELSAFHISDGTEWFSVAGNIPTSLSLGTVGTDTVGITSDGGVDDVILPASVGLSTAGLMTSDQADILDVTETLINLHVGGTGADHTYIDQDVSTTSAPIFDATNFTNTFWTGTQAQYDLLTPDADTLYVVVG